MADVTYTTSRASNWRSVIPRRVQKPSRGNIRQHAGGVQQAKTPQAEKKYSFSQNNRAARGDRVFAGLTEKADLVKALIDGGLVQIIPEEVRQLDATRAAVAAWSIRQLKQLMADVGVDSTRCVDKRDLVDAIAASGLVAFAADDDDATAPADEGVS